MDPTLFDILIRDLEKKSEVTISKVLQEAQSLREEAKDAYGCTTLC